MKNFHAYTEVNYAPANYPGYVSLNKKDDGTIVLSVRSRNAQVPSEIEMSPEALEQLAIDIMANINGDA